MTAAFRTVLLSLSLASMAGLPAAAGDAVIGLELNRAETVGGACTLTFVATGSAPARIDRLVLEAVLFTTDGLVERLTLFDFGALPADRPRVRQFSIPDLPCETVGRILVNGAETCEGEGLDPETCEAGLTPTSRDRIELVG